jgi:hypothetical protein
MYADSITKSFLDAGSSTFTQFDDHQDPTYIGFQVKIEPSLNVEGDMDDLPHGLFTLDPIQDPYSCYNYLMNRGETKRAEYILAFEEGFSRIVSEYPWYFVKVTGLADSWKIDTKNNFRGKEKKIVIETLESIDLRMTMILDLYRKATFDSAYMRWAVPDHMRYFRMKIIVSEIRPMKLSTQGYNNSGPNPGVINGVATNLKLSLGNLIANSPETGLWDTAAPWSAGTFIEFSYSECELDVFNEAPTFLESVGNKPEAEATNKITILTHVIHEKNVYGLLGAILEDTPDWRDYTTSDNPDDGGIYNPANADGEFISDSTQNKAGGPSITKYVNGYLDRKRAQTNFQSFTSATADANDINLPAGTYNEVYWDEKHKPTEAYTEATTDVNDINLPAGTYNEVYWDENHKPTEAYTEATTDVNDINLPSGTYNEVYWDENHKPADAKAAETNDADGFTDSSKDFVKNKWDDTRKPTESFTSATTDVNDINLPAGTYNEVYWDEKHKPEDPKAAEISQSADPGNKSTTEAAKDFDKDHKPEDRKAATISYRRNGLRRAVNRALLGNAYGSSPLTLIGSAQSIINNPVAAIEAILKKHSSPAIGKDLARKVQLTGQEIQLVKSIIGASTTGAEDNVKVNPALVKNQGKTNLDSANINSKDPGKVFLRAPKKAKAKNENSNLTTFANAGSKPGQVELEGTSPPAARAQKEKLEGPTIIPAKLGKVLLASAPVEKVKLGKTNLE